MTDEKGEGERWGTDERGGVNIINGYYIHL